ncbi:MAG: hypothetical protein ACRD2C_17935 [Acidimicrobiales bacterium]
MDTDATGSGFTDFSDSTRRQMAADAEDHQRPWWDTPTASVVCDLARAGPFVAALAGVIAVLREGHDPMWAVGGDSAGEAFDVVQEWIAAGVDPTEVGDWIRAGCWSATAARQMSTSGIRPHRLLDVEGKPVHWLDVGPDGPIPLALAVADSYLTPDQAVRHLFRAASSA